MLIWIPTGGLLSGFHFLWMLVYKGWERVRFSFHSSYYIGAYLWILEVG